MGNIKKAHKKKKKKAKGNSYNFSALHLVHGPQDFSEKLFRKLEGLTEKFEVKLMLLERVSRLIGTHQLILLNYYPYIARFLAPPPEGGGEAATVLSPSSSRSRATR